MNAIGMIGLGQMGGAIARRIASLGHPVLAYDPQHTHDLEGVVTWASTPADVAASCMTVLIAVATDIQLDQVLAGPGGLLEMARPGHCVIVHSTIHPRTAATAERALAAHGALGIDAGMSRGEGRMRDGCLTLMAGGCEQALEAALPTMRLYSDNVIACGGPGAGMTVKLSNNLALHANRLALLEAVALAEHQGVASASALAALNAGTGASWASRHWDSSSSAVFTGGSGPTAMAERTDRELALALSVASELGVSLPAANLTAERLTALFTAGWPCAEESEPAYLRVVDEIRSGRRAEPLLLLTTVGARSGRLYTRPLSYEPDGDTLLVFATNGGRAQPPHWLSNLRAKPQVFIEIDGEVARAVAEEVVGPEREEAFARRVAARPQYAEYAELAGREIPVVRLTRLAVPQSRPAPSDAVGAEAG